MISRDFVVPVATVAPVCRSRAMLKCAGEIGARPYLTPGLLAVTM
jgi:hypothetical protein